MVTLRSYDYIKNHSAYRRGFTLTFPPFQSSDLFFEITDGQTDLLSKHESTGEYLEKVQLGSLPQGIHRVKSLDNDRYFLIVCDKSARDTAVRFAESLFK